MRPTAAAPFLSPFLSPARRRPTSGPVRLAVDVLTKLAGMATTPAVDQLASALRWPVAELARVLAAMERSGLVERWPDPDRPGVSRVMLSARSLARLGLALSPRGDRWDPDARGPRPINDRRGPRRH